MNENPPDPHGQSQYQVRFDWGIDGAMAVGRDADVIIVVDVLSFGTAVIAAAEAGIDVIPSDPADAEDVASRHGATLASARGERQSLSPGSLSAAFDAGTRVVLPSPNGSSICASLLGHRSIVVAGAVRNRRAIAEWALERQGARGDRFVVAVIAAGERRPDGAAPRFAVEDLLGAGAIIDALADLGIDYYSPEAAAAAAAFGGLRHATRQLIRASASGQELIAKGFERDVDIATEVDGSSVVPVLGEFGFRAARSD